MHSTFGEEWRGVVKPNFGVACKGHAPAILQSKVLLLCTWAKTGTSLRETSQAISSFASKSKCKQVLNFCKHVQLHSRNAPCRGRKIVTLCMNKVHFYRRHADTDTTWWYIRYFAKLNEVNSFNVHGDKSNNNQCAFDNAKDRNGIKLSLICLNYITCISLLYKLGLTNINSTTHWG